MRSDSSDCNSYMPGLLHVSHQQFCMASFDHPHLIYGKPVIFQIAALLVKRVAGLMDGAGETLTSRQHISDFSS